MLGLRKYLQESGEGQAKVSMASSENFVGLFWLLGDSEVYLLKREDSHSLAWYVCSTV